MRRWFVVGLSMAAVLAAPQVRSADITDLDPSYTGLGWSRGIRAREGQTLLLIRESVSGDKFNGTLVRASKGPDPIYLGSGKVTSAGAFTFKGVAEDGDGTLTINLKGQISTSGDAVNGTYKEKGKSDQGNVTDSGAFSLVSDTL